jgi:Uma2 family endonuclease
MGSTLLLESELSIPAGVDDFAAFRLWVDSPEFPERGRIDYIGDHVEVDTMVEDPTYHGLPKVEIARVIANRVKQLDWGNVYVDATRVACPAVKLSVEPDIVCVSHESFENARVVLVPSSRRSSQFLELEGAPELVVEVVSRSSVTKDNSRLWRSYHAAGVDEYWTVDARRGKLKFEIWRRGAEEYELAEKTADGYQPSSVLRASYRLEQRQRRDGRLMYDLLEIPDAE